MWSLLKAKVSPKFQKLELALQSACWIYCCCGSGMRRKISMQESLLLWLRYDDPVEAAYTSNYYDSGL